MAGLTPPGARFGGSSGSSTKSQARPFTVGVAGVANRAHASRSATAVGGRFCTGVARHQFRRARPRRLPCRRFSQQGSRTTFSVIRIGLPLRTRQPSEIAPVRSTDATSTRAASAASGSRRIRPDWMANCRRERVHPACFHVARAHDASDSLVQHREPRSRQKLSSESASGAVRKSVLIPADASKRLAVEGGVLSGLRWSRYT